MADNQYTNASGLKFSKGLIKVTRIQVQLLTKGINVERRL